jgi:hypothetical protein
MAVHSDCNLIKSVALATGSPHQARYHLRLYELPHGSGFVISKLSGPTGKATAAEEWYRPTLHQAEKKLAALVRAKTTRQVGRQHQKTPASVQMALW